MKLNRNVLFCGALLAAASAVIADDVVRERPAEWKDLVFGGQYKDLFEPMPIRSPLTRNTWGGDNVLPRDVSNGIEETDWSYWCAFPFKDAEGGYHLYTARWPEGEPRGHFGYFDSIIVHAVADNPFGPYRYRDTLGPGHNPELYRMKNGSYMVYSTHGRFFVSDSLNGPWKAGTYNFDKRERFAVRNYVNFSFAPRDDGSFIAVSRRGYIWASEDGGENWSEVSADSIYPKVPGIFEDPVMWKDEVQYNIIVNDWKGRIAYHLRSKDGFHWKTEPGEAYVPGIARYEDGTLNDWYKFERIRMVQDEQGRPTHALFAVIDSDKHSDKPFDRHSSKSIVIPVTKARLLAVLNEQAITAGTREIRVRLQAEDGFDPHKDVDLDSLRFGASLEVNYGRGARLARTEKAGKDLVLVFEGKGHGIAEEDFAAKLLGKTKEGKLLYGWSRLPEVRWTVPVLSALSPKFEYADGALEAYVETQNFGEAASEQATMKLLRKSGEVIAEGKVRPLMPFEKSIVPLPCREPLPAGSKQTVTVLIESPGLPAETFTKEVKLPRN